MNHTLIVAAGFVGIAGSIIHGYLGHTKVVDPVQNVPETMKRILAAVMFLTALYWFSVSVALVLAPFLLDQQTQHLVSAVALALFVPACVANFWATRGRHFGWMVLLVVNLLVVAGSSDLYWK